MINLTVALDELHLKFPFLEENHEVEANYTTNKKGIFSLPSEVIQKIVWAVVGRNLDYKSLGKLGLTCKNLYKR